MKACRHGEIIPFKVPHQIIINIKRCELRSITDAADIPSIGSAILGICFEKFQAQINIWLTKKQFKTLGHYRN